MMYYSVSDIGIPSKRKSECSDYNFGCSTTELQETRES